MPLIFQIQGYRFYFYSNEGNPREPIHVHVTKDAVDAKFWLRPDVKLAYNDGFDARTLRWLSGVIASRKQNIEAAWHDHFGIS